MPSSKVTRYNREEFAELIAARLHHLEAQQEAQRQYSHLLLVLRGQLNSYLQEKKR
ncbi:hypothetical protein [Hymenobacter koreensis]|uniref:Uncharacterized protein n=1 Tax=Hymenobacter koreensis TaxID=1084523 RepID=A0ABP8J4M7_9BACT